MPRLIELPDLLLLGSQHEVLTHNPGLIFHYRCNIILAKMQHMFQLLRKYQILEFSIYGNILTTSAPAFRGNFVMYLNEKLMTLFIQSFFQSKVFHLIMIIAVKMGMVLLEDYVFELDFVPQGMELAGMLIKDSVKFTFKWLRKM